MKVALALFCASFVPLVCIVAAAWLAFNGKDGWGWFLVVAVLLTEKVQE
jgi:hypothetical protein